MHLARILRFFGLRSRHGGGGRRSRLSIRMSRVFHRHSSRRSTVDSGAAPTPGVGQRAPARCSEAPSRMLIPENEPVALDWGMSSSNSMDLRKSSRSSLARQDDLDRRLLVQRLILEELQHHARRGTAATRDSRMSMIEQAQVLSTSLLEARGSGVFSLRPASRDGRVQSLSRREEKQLRKSIARTIRAEEKQQKKLEKLNRKRAKQYARAQEFFEQRSTDASYFHTSSYNRSGQSDSCHFDVIDATETKRRRHRSDSAASSLSRRSSNTSVRSRSSSKPPRMEFLFFGGSPDDTGSLHELEVGRRLLQRRSSAVRNDTVLRGANSLETYDAELIKINPTLVRNMPRPFAPRMNRLEVFI